MASNANARETVKRLMYRIQNPENDIEDILRALQHLIAEANGQAMIAEEEPLEIRHPPSNWQSSTKYDYYMNNYYSRICKLLNELDLYPSDPVFKASAVDP